MAQYEFIKKDELLIVIQQLLLKLKNSSLAKDTTYTIEKTASGFSLKDDSGAVISSYDIPEYKDVTDDASGLITPELFKKLKGIAAGAEVNTIASVSVNGTALTITGKSVNITVPTTAEIQSMIDTSVAAAASGHLTRQVVDALPALADMKEDVIYMVPKETKEDGNSYYEYMKIGGKVEQIGDTKPDLSGYLKTSDIAALTNEELIAVADTAYANVFGS